MKFNKTTSFALVSQGILISLGLINVVLNTKFLSERDLGLYYSLAVLALIKELLNGGVLATYISLLVKQNGVDTINFKKYFRYITNFFFFLAPCIVLISYSYIKILLGETSLLISTLFSITLGLEVLTVWFFPTLECLGKLSKLYTLRTIIAFFSYISAWYILYTTNSVLSLVCFLFVTSIFKGIFAYYFFSKYFKIGISYLKQPTEFNVIARKVSVTYYANLTHKISIYPIINSTLGLEISGVFGVANSIFSSAATLSRELIRKNLKKYGQLSIKSSLKVFLLFRKDLAFANLLYVFSIGLAVSLITVFPQIIKVSGIYSIIILTFFYHFSYFNFGQITHLHRINLKEPMSLWSVVYCLMTFTFLLIKDEMIFFIFLSLLTFIFLLIPTIYYTRYYTNMNN